MIQLKFASIENAEYQGNSLKDLFLGLRQRGDVKDLSEGAYKYIYNVGKLNDGLVFALTKENNVFSAQLGKDVSEACKSKRRSLVEAHYQFLKESFGESMAFAGLNYLKSGTDPVVSDESVVKHMFDEFISTLEHDLELKYTFEKDSDDKIDFDIEIEKYNGRSLFNIPELMPATGNFDWSIQRDFTKHHNKVG